MERTSPRTRTTIAQWLANAYLARCTQLHLRERGTIHRRWARRLLGWELAVGLDRALVRGVQRLDRIGEGQYLAWLQVIVQERDEFTPCARTAG
jgi:hypothetical protein